MKRRWTFIFLICWFILSLLLIGSRFYRLPNEQILINLSQELHAEGKKTQYHFSGRVNKEIASEDLDQWVQKLVRALSLKSLTKEAEADGIRYHAEKLHSTLHYELQIINDHPKRELVHPYVVLIVNNKEISKKALISEMEDLHSILQSFGILVDYHVSFQWEMKTGQTLQEVSDEILSYLRAKKVEGMVTERTLSISAQSPLFSGKLPTGKDWMNLQVATRWNDDHSRMIVTVGTPIITMEY